MAEKSEKELQFEKILAEQLMEFRESRNLTLTEMGMRSGMSRQQYEKFERQERTPTLYSLYRIFSDTNADPGVFVCEVFSKFENQIKPQQVLADRDAAKEYYKNTRKKKAQSED